MAYRKGRFWDHFFLQSLYNDIPEEVLFGISKFANEKKASRVNTLNDIRSMQRTLQIIYLGK